MPLVCCRKLFHVSLFAVVVVGARHRSVHADEVERPNIILIVADDLGFGELGCYGQKRIRTPRVDALAAEGARFTQFYAGAPVCAPSRCTLMTGKHTGHAAIRDNRESGHWTPLAAQYDSEFTGQEPLPADEQTLAELLKERGYATGAFGKWGLGHLGTEGAPNLQGFDLFYGYYCQRHAHNHYPKFLWRNDQRETLADNDGKSIDGQTYSQDKFIANALAFVREHKDGPFFLYLPVTVPHLSIQVPEASLAEYAGKLSENNDAPAAGGGSHYFNHPKPHAGYAAMVSHLDRGVGQVVDLVHELGLDENTLILFTSDNGPTFDIGGADSEFFNSTAGLRGRKGSVYEGGVRAPLIARWKGKIAPGATPDLPAALWDLLPTLCEIAHARTPVGIDGISLAPTLLASRPQPEHDYLYWEFPARGGQQALRAKNLKAVRTGIARGEQRWQLYDLAIDPAEQHDLAKERPNEVKQLAKLAATARTPSQVFPFTPPAD